MAEAASQQNDEPEQARTRPVEEIKYGNVKVAIWRNHGKNGDFYTAGTPQIRYQDDKNQWQDSKSHGISDLLMMGKAVEKAADRLVELNKERGQSR